MTEAIPLSWVIGTNLREWREKAGLSQEDLAAMVRVDLDWTRSTVGKVERGERMLELDEVAVLASLVGGFRLLDSPAPIQVTERGATFPPHFLANLFDPRMADPAFSGVEDAFHAIHRKVAAVLSELPHEVERRAAARLSITVERLADETKKLYGRNFVEERDGRVRQLQDSGDIRSLRAIRGQVSGELIKEVRGHLRASAPKSRRKQPRARKS
jgi:transcriptional regulator with XRE-family HTH domain